MTALRQLMIRELKLQRKAEKTIEAYVHAVSALAWYHHRSPDQLSIEQIRHYLHYLIAERKLSFSSCNQQTGGHSFLLRASVEVAEARSAGAGQAVTAVAGSLQPSTGQTAAANARQPQTPRRTHDRLRDGNARRRIDPDPT